MSLKSNTDNLVSIITSTFNNQETIEECWNSVKAQTYKNWEWILVNDGSTDGTQEVLLKFRDERIRTVYFRENHGVSYGRNHALKMAKGNFICFLDGDDTLPNKSIESRVNAFEDQIDFVDGSTRILFEGNDLPEKIRSSSFYGDPLDQLLQISPLVFFGQTWMIRNKSGTDYEFDNSLDHGEDLLFFISLATGGHLKCIDDLVLNYRKRVGSATSNIFGIEKGYYQSYARILKFNHISKKQAKIFRNKTASIMIKTYLKAYDFRSVLRVFYRFYVKI